MPSLADELAADLADAVGGYEQTFEWKGRDFPCVRNSAAAGAKDMPGGWIEGVDFTLLVSLAVFAGGDVPQIGDLIDSNAAQIKMIDPNIAQMIIHAGSPDE